MSHENHHETLFDPEKFRVVVDEIESRDKLLTGLDLWLEAKGHTPESLEIVTEILEIVREKYPNE